MSNEDHIRKEALRAEALRGIELLEFELDGVKSQVGQIRTYLAQHADTDEIATLKAKTAYLAKCIHEGLRGIEEVPCLRGTASDD